MPCTRLSGAPDARRRATGEGIHRQPIIFREPAMTPPLFTATALTILIATALTCTPTLGSGSDWLVLATPVDERGGIMPHAAPERPDFSAVGNPAIAYGSRDATPARTPLGFPGLPSAPKSRSDNVDQSRCRSVLAQGPPWPGPQGAGTRSGAAVSCAQGSPVQLLDYGLLSGDS